LATGSAADLAAELAALPGVSVVSAALEPSGRGPRSPSAWPVAGSPPVAGELSPTVVVSSFMNELLAVCEEAGR
jgi:hypothetical protein